MPKEDQKIEVKKELFWEAPYPGCRCDAVIAGYLSAAEPRLLGAYRETVHAADETSLKTTLTSTETKVNTVTFSEDNGETWKEMEPLHASSGFHEVGTSHYLDVENNVFFYFILHHEMDQDKLAGRHSMTYSQQLYRMSRDGGRTWGKHELMIQKGDEFDESHPARRTWYGKNGGYVCTEAIKIRNGSILMPFFMWPWDEKQQRLIPQRKPCAVFIGRWTEDASRIEWDLGDYIEPPADGNFGFAELTVAELNNGQVMGIMRAGLESMPTKFRCISADGGWTWSKPEPLTYDTGDQVLSPPSYSRFCRSSRNGKLYWIGNMLPPREDMYAPVPSNLKRFILQIAEVNEDNYSIRKETVTIIDESREGEMPREYSNFGLYEDRVSGNFILTMCEACGLPVDLPKYRAMYPSYRGPYQTRENSTAHSYRYEIKL